MIKSQIESLLFISVKPVSVKELAKVLSVSYDEVKENIEVLQKEYKFSNKGMKILEVKQAEIIKYQMVTNPEFSDLIKKFTKQEVSNDLTKPALETLTIIAYKGPITKPELEKIRGVNCSMILRNLMIRGLVEEQNDVQKGLAAFNVAADFLQWLGVSSVTQLPDYEAMTQDQNLIDLLESKEK